MGSQPKAKVPKGLPKRVRNDKAKARRARSWERTQRRKADRRNAQHERERENQRRRDRGEPTPWEQAKATRKRRRLLERT